MLKCGQRMYVSGNPFNNLSKYVYRPNVAIQSTAQLTAPLSLPNEFWQGKQELFEIKAKKWCRTKQTSSV